jgi:hypothetical protein
LISIELVAASTLCTWWAHKPPEAFQQQTISKGQAHFN